MNLKSSRILIGTFFITAMVGVFGPDIAQTETKDNHMATTTTELPGIDLAIPEATETAIFALG